MEGHCLKAWLVVSTMETALVALADDLEEEVGAALVDGQVADLVEDEQGRGIRIGNPDLGQNPDWIRIGVLSESGLDPDWGHIFAFDRAISTAIRCATGWPTSFAHSAASVTSCKRGSWISRVALGCAGRTMR